MELQDYDGDEEDELSVILYSMAASDRYIQELHILELSGNNRLNDYVLDGPAVKAMLYKDHGLSSSFDPDTMTVQVQLDNQYFIIDIADNGPDLFTQEYEGLELTNNIGFYSEDGTLFVEIAAGAGGFGWGKAYARFLLRANIVYNGIPNYLGTDMGYDENDYFSLVNTQMSNQDSDTENIETKLKAQINKAEDDYLSELSDEEVGTVLRMQSIHKGSFTETGDSEILAVFRVLSTPHAAGLNRTIAAVYDADTLIIKN
jgi:hypothetical protein